MPGRTITHPILPTRILNHHQFSIIQRKRIVHRSKSEDSNRPIEDQEKQMHHNQTQLLPTLEIPTKEPKGTQAHQTKL